MVKEEAAIESRKYLIEIANTLSPTLKEICLGVINSDRFYKQSGSENHHHSFTGGLICHVAEVVAYCQNVLNSGFDSSLNRDILLTGAILHDLGKVWDYEVNPDDTSKFRKTRHNKMIGHICRGYSEWNLMRQEQASKGNYIDDETADNICHLILSHHVRPEYGSPISPSTKESQILASADQYSAYYGPTK